MLDNMALVNWCIKKYIKIEPDDYEDLFQEGCIGLMMAAKRFKPELGYTFSTFAIQTITGVLKRYKNFRSNRFYGLHMSNSIVNNYHTIAKIMDEYQTDELTAEIIAESGLTAEQASQAFVRFFSKDSQMYTDDGEEMRFEDTLADNIDIEYEFISNENTEYIINYLKSKLTPRDFDIFEEYYYSYTIGGEKITAEQLAKQYKISKQRINVIKQNIQSLVRIAYLKLEKS